MKFQRKGLLAVLGTALCSVVILLLNFAKITPIIGQAFEFFSLSDVVMPLSGNLGFSFIGLVVALRVGMKTLLIGTPLIALVYHIPGFCASAYWAMENKLISLIIPLICMGAFIAHPIGLQAAPYSLYWLIPMALFFVPRKTIFMHSLASTFIAHAVGSVVWLYLHPMGPEVWYGLIPVVAVERLMFASGMTLVYYVCSFAKNWVMGKYTQKRFGQESILS